MESFTSDGVAAAVETLRDFAERIEYIKQIEYLGCLAENNHGVHVCK